MSSTALTSGWMSADAGDPVSDMAERLKSGMTVFEILVQRAIPYGFVSVRMLIDRRFRADAASANELIQMMLKERVIKSCEDAASWVICVTPEEWRARCNERLDECR